MLNAVRQDSRMQEESHSLPPESLLQNTFYYTGADCPVALTKVQL